MQTSPSSNTISIPRDQWTRLMREMRDIRARQAELQGDLARVLGELSDYALECVRPGADEARTVEAQKKEPQAGREAATITVHDGNGNNATMLTRQQYADLRASGMLWEFHPDAPEHWPHAEA